MAMTAGVSDGVRRIPALDGLRAAAAIAVIISHASYTGVQISNTGGLGVTIFFTLSGFLMAFLYANQTFDRKSVTIYIISRVTRIAPLYLLIIVIAFIIHTWVDIEFVYVITPSNILRHLLFSGSQAVFWSIPPEVQFYGFFLAIWWSKQAAHQARFRPAIMTCCMIALMLAFSHDLPGTTLPTKLVFFLFGSIAGFVANSVALSLSPIVCTILQFSMVFIVPIIDFVTSDDLTLYQSVSYAFACGLMIFAFSLPSTFGDIIFGNRAMRALGEWSFAIYLIHDPCLYWTQKLMHREGLQVFVIGASISVLMAWVLHQLVESPAQKWMKVVINKYVLQLQFLHRVVVDHA